MRAKNAAVLTVFVLITVLAAILALNGLTVGEKTLVKPAGDMLSLGLDLRGGIYTVFRAEKGEYTNEEFSDLLTATGEVLRTRLTEQGYTEANVSMQGSDCIRIEIPDISDPEEIVRLIGTPAHLTFTDPYGSVIVEGNQIEKVEPVFLQDQGGYVVAFQLNDEAAKAFSAATARLVGKVIAINLDGQTISTPTVNERIPDGSGSISLGNIKDMTESYNAAKRLSTLIMSGALPLDIEESETRAISATLGEDAVHYALIAGIIGVGLVLAFMLVMYRLPGLAADLALVWYIVIVFFLLGLLGIQLTLPGIAGILLGIGMAVDANVIVFERFREELKAGRSYPSAVKTGFKNALRAILDANVTTMIAACVLMYFGTGSVKGFSYTLALSVVISMFTAVFVTRFLLTRIVRLGFTRKGLYTR